jgi:hypothetical protein
MTGRTGDHERDLSSALRERVDCREARAGGGTRRLPRLRARVGVGIELAAAGRAE